MRAVPLYATIGSLVLSALTAAPATASDGPGPASAEERGTAVAAARAAAAGISFKACPEEEMLPEYLKCGTVRVPLDYARPDGRTIALTVSRTTATGPAAGRQGSFVYNPGGPGASSITFPLMGEMSEWEEVAEAYDMVGYAPRGVGASAPLSCQDPAAFAQSPTDSPADPTTAYKEKRVAQARAYARGCEKNAGEALGHYTSLNNARDLEVLRAALGDERLTFMGASYGTYIGSLYATLFPSRVRRMVFDSAVDPDPEKIWYRSNLDQSLAFESRWLDFRRWVARHDDVYGLGTTPEAVQRRYDEVRTALASEPAGGKVGPGQFQAAFLQAGYYDDYWAMRATALSEYVRGNPEPLVTQMSPRAITAKDDENERAVYTAVECNDAPWPEEWELWDRDHTDLATVAPFQTWNNAFTNLPCAFWPAPRQRPLDVSTARGELPPVLILAAERDAATPYKGALELQRRLRGAVLVTERDAGTHGVGGAGNACVDEHMRRYLLTGAVPAGDAECAPRAEPNAVSLD